MDGPAWPVVGPRLSPGVRGGGSELRARLHQPSEDVWSRGEDGDSWAIGSGRRAADRDRVEGFASVDHLGEQAGLLLVDVGSEVVSGCVVHGDCVLVVLVCWFTDEYDGPSEGEVACLACGLVVVLASEVRDVHAGVREPPVGRTDQQPSGVLAEPQYGLVAGVRVGDQMKCWQPVVGRRTVPCRRRVGRTSSARGRRVRVAPGEVLVRFRDRFRAFEPRKRRIRSAWHGARDGKPSGTGDRHLAVRGQTAWSRRECFGLVLAAGVLCCCTVAVLLSWVCLISRGSAIGITALVPTRSRMRRTWGWMQVKTRLIRASLAAWWISSRELTPAAPQKLTPLRSSRSTRAGRRSARRATSVNESAVAMSISPATVRRSGAVAMVNLEGQVTRSRSSQNLASGEGYERSAAWLARLPACWPPLDQTTSLPRSVPKRAQPGVPGKSRVDLIDLAQLTLLLRTDTSQIQKDEVSIPCLARFAVSLSREHRPRSPVAIRSDLGLGPSS